MILYDKDGNRYIASKVKRPGMKNVGGRCWTHKITCLDHLPMRFFYEAFNGAAFYFRVGSRQWFRLPLDVTNLDTQDFFTQPPTQGPMAAKAGTQ